MLLECCSILENLENLPQLARNGTRALVQAMYDSMYHQPGIGGPDNLSRLHLRAQSQIDHTRTVRLVRLRIVRITAQGRDWCLVLGLLVFIWWSHRDFSPPLGLASIWWSDRDFPNPQFAESFLIIRSQTGGGSWDLLACIWWPDRAFSTFNVLIHLLVMISQRGNSARFLSESRPNSNDSSSSA